MSFRSRSPAQPAEADRRVVHPGTITSIEPQCRAPGRFAIAIDGRLALTLAEDVVAAARLEVGANLDEETIAALLDRDDVSRATETALGFLSYRPRSEREVRDRLRRASYGQDVIDQVMAKLHDWRYLDDADFARRWVEGRAAGRPRGRRLLQQELRQKGIDTETAREVLDEADLDELAAAEALARKRLATIAGGDPAAVRRRLGAYLARRGYGFDVVRAALERALGEADDPDNDPPE